jgi:hypothetical protein
MVKGVIFAQKARFNLAEINDVHFEAGARWTIGLTVVVSATLLQEAAEKGAGRVSACRWWRAPPGGL